MVLNRASLTNVFTPEWVAQASPSPEAGMVAKGEIFDNNGGTAAWVPGTGMTVTKTTWYGANGLGKMRIQPLQSTGNVEGDWTQGVLVSVPITGPFTPGMEARVGFSLKISSAPLMTELTKYLFTCVEVMDSSNPVERTLKFKVNHAVSG